MTLVKEDLIESLYNQAEISKQESKALVDNVFEHDQEIPGIRGRCPP
jgi:nucleoid DNA-binding protein